MENKKPFKRVDVESQQEQAESTDTLDEVMEQIDNNVDDAVVDLLQELGYNAKRDMTLEETQELQEQLTRDNLEVQIEPEQQDDTYKVAIKVSQVAKVLTFNLPD